MEIVVEGQNQPVIESLDFMDEGEVDRISALPDCLLIEILSRLPSTKGAIRTGTLSKRWKNLSTLVPTLISEHNGNDIHDFVSFVDKTLTQLRQLNLKKFVVDIIYDIQFESQVKSWIRYAITSNTEELKLTLWDMDFDVELLLDPSFFITSCFTDMTLERNIVLNPIGAIRWKNLKRLCFSYVNLDEVLIENIFSGNPQLETLVLHDCCDFRRLDITSKRVKNLVFAGYIDPNSYSETHMIKINAPYSIINNPR